MGVWYENVLISTDYKILDILINRFTKKGDGYPVMELSSKVGIAHTNTLVRLKFLESKGMIKRERRGKFIHIFPAHKGIVKYTLDKSVALIGQIWESVEDIQIHEGEIRIINENKTAYKQIIKFLNNQEIEFLNKGDASDTKKNETHKKKL